MNNEGDTETIDLSNPVYKFVPNEHHNWKQQGPYLVCKGCELVHAVYVGMDQVLTGLDNEGKPILKARKSITEH